MKRETKYLLSGLPGVAGFVIFSFGAIAFCFRFPEILLILIGALLFYISDQLLKKFR